VGTRPAGGVAAAWAILQHLGAEGYRRIAAQLLDGVDRYVNALQAMPGVHVVGQPDLAIVAWGSDELDPYAIAKHLYQRAWLPSLLKRPRAVHRMMSMLHIATLDDYLSDLQWAIGETRAQGAQAGPALQARYS
jgi:sphinganine-1-phosphate aldolase